MTISTLQARKWQLRASIDTLQARFSCVPNPSVQAVDNNVHDVLAKVFHDLTLIFQMNLL